MRRLIASALCILMLMVYFTGCKKYKTDNDSTSYSSSEKSETETSEDIDSEKKSSSESLPTKSSSEKTSEAKNQLKNNPTEESASSSPQDTSSSRPFQSTDTSDKNTDFITDKTDNYVNGVW